MVSEVLLFLNNIGISLANHPILLSIAGGIFGGEIAILTLSFLAAQGLFPLWIIFVFFWIGEIISDAIYFEFGRQSKLHNLRN